MAFACLSADDSFTLTSTKRLSSLEPYRLTRHVDCVWFELTHSLRRLGRSAGFSAVFIVTIGSAIGATVAVGSVGQAILLRKVAVPEPDRLVEISATDPKTNLPGFLYSDTLSAFQERQRAFSRFSLYATRMVRVEGVGATVDGVVESVSPDYFEMLGAAAGTGRLFAASDNANNAIVVLSDRFRKRAFGEGTNLIGQQLRIDGREAVIIGVAVPGFAGLDFDGGADLFVPFSLLQTPVGGKGSFRTRSIIGQLAPGIALPAATAELRTQWPELQKTALPPSIPANQRQALLEQEVTVKAFGHGFSAIRERYGDSVGILVGLTGILLLIAGLNLAALMVARALAQRPQTALRLALGASRARVSAQVLIDCVLLSLGGFILALPFALVVTRQLAEMLSYRRGTPLIVNLAPEATTIALIGALATLVGLLIGILPAKYGTTSGVAQLHFSRSIARSLGQSGRFLLVAQVALSMLLLVWAGLFTSTLSGLRSNYAALGQSGILFTRLAALPGDRRPVPAMYGQALVTELSGVPQVDSASLSSFFPAYLTFLGSLPLDRYQRSEASSGEAAALTDFVSPGFFETYGIARLRGRDFAWTDGAEAPPVVIVTRSLADRLFAKDDAVGQRLRMNAAAGSKDFEIVGVVEDAPFGSSREPRQPAVFKSILQEPARIGSAMAHVRHRGDAKAVADGINLAIERQGRHFVRTPFSFVEFADSALLNERLIASIAGFASLLVVILACIGLYSALAHAVTARIREIGIRSALGASRSGLVRMIVKEGLVVVIPGIILGIVGALAAGRVVSALLYGLGPADPFVISLASLTFVATSLAASIAPAMSAASIDPVEALRQE